MAATNLRIFCGDDSHASYLAGKNYAQKLSKDLGLPLQVLDADDISVNELLQNLQNIGLFASGKVVFAKRLFENKSQLENLEQNLEKYLGLPLVIWHADKFDKRKQLYKQLNKQKLVEEYTEGKSWEVEKWLISELKKLGLSATDSTSAAGDLIMHVGTNKGVLLMELEKINLYKQANNELPMISSILGTDVSGDIWKFLDKLALGDKGQAATELERLLTYGEGDQYIIAMLTRELQLLSEYLHTNSLKAPSFVVQKVKEKAKNFSTVKVKKLLQALLRLDLAIKQGRLDPKVGLTLYLLSW